MPPSSTSAPAGDGPAPARTSRRGRRQLLVAGFVLAYLAAGAVTLVLGERVAGGRWLALHLVLLGAATNAIVVWSEHFAAALLRTRPVSEGLATARALVLNLGILAVLWGVQTGRSAVAAGGACVVGVVVLGHGLVLATRIGSALPGRLSGTVWFYVAAAAALLAGMGMGLWLAGGVAASAGAYLALRLAHVHLNVLGWVGLAVVGTQFTLWPTVLRTRMVPGLEWAVRWSLPPLALGLAVAAGGLASQRRGVALVGLVGMRSGLGIALVPFVRTAVRRPPRTAAAWMLGAGMVWFAVAVVADLGALVDQPAGGRPGRTGGPAGPRRGGRVRAADADRGAHLPAAGGVRPRAPTATAGSPASSSWAGPLRVAAVNLGVRAAGRRAGPGGWWLAGIGLASFVPLAVVALVVRDPPPELTARVSRTGWRRGPRRRCRGARR